MTPQERGARNAARAYRQFHQANPDRGIRVSLPNPPAEAAAIGVVRAIEYEVPADWPSTKEHGVSYRHKFGDTGHGDTGAKPLLIDGGEGLLYVKSRPGEKPFVVKDWLIG